MFLTFSLALSALLLSVGGFLLLLSLSHAVYVLLADVKGRSAEALRKERLKDTMPDTVAEIAEQESEPWARAEVRDEAVRLYDILGDWEAVEVELRRRYPPLTPEEAANRAWGMAAVGGDE